MKSKTVSENFIRGVLAVVFLFCFAGTAAANLGVVKVYKETFSDEKPKCTCCHMDKMPKKEEGEHEFNDYGKKVFAAKTELKKEKVDEEVLKKVGKNEAAEE